MKTVAFPSLLLAFAAAAHAQGPDVIHYTFDSMNAANSASPGVGDGVTTDIAFTAGVCGAGQAEMAATGGSIDSGWTVDLGTSSWTVGMFIDLSVGGNGFQYVFGSGSTGGMRCFCNGAAGADNIILRTLNGPIANDVILPGGAPSTGTIHCVWSYDANTLIVTGYVDGIEVASVLQPNPIDYTGTSADFNVMSYTGTGMSAGNKLDDFRLYRRALSASEVLAWSNCGGATLGTNFCTALPNSTGATGVISATGSDVAADNNLTLVASSLPPGQFGIFVVSPQTGMSNVGAGILCLGGQIGRYMEASQIRQASPAGEFSLTIDLTMVPTPNSFMSVASGDTLYFQAWHRDGGPAAPSSNFTDGLQIDFL